MKVKWIRGRETFRFTRPDTWFALGTRGSGKSSLLETIACQYLERNASILDLFGSRDGEGLAWLRSPYAKDKKILLVKGDSVDIECSFPVKHVEKLRLRDFEEYDVIVSASPFYVNIGSEFYYAAKLTDLLYRRLHYKRLVYMVCREAANLYYSRLKINENQVFAKSEIIYMLREARHMGIALGLDSVRYFSVDIDVRSLADYMMLKSQGLQGLSKELKFLYSFVDPHLVRKLKPSQFLVLTRRGNIGYGVFPEVSWHKQEREDILRSIGIKVEYGEELKEAEFKGTFKTVSDREHASIIRLYVEEALSMDLIAKKLKRSPRTPHTHIHAHNQAVTRSGFCAACKRAGSQYYNVVAERRKM